MTVAGGVRDEVEGLIREEQARHPIPGVSIGVSGPDGEWTAGFGVTSVEHPLDVTGDTLFQIGSISKTFLGTLVMRLVDQGTLDLDVPLRRWLPGLRLRDEDAAARVTLRHCLTHYCGWFGDHFIETGWNDDALERYVATMAELEQQVPLGSEWAYNNAAFGLAGRVVEAVTGKAIEYVMRHELFVPLGLRQTHFFAGSVLTHRFAVGHNVFGSEPRVVRPWALPRASNCVGGIVSTVPDLLRYARFHMGDGRAADGARYLSEAAITHMRSPLVAGPLGQQRGIAWSVQESRGVRIIGHGGATFGQQAMLWIAPERAWALAMLMNSNQTAQLQNRITRWSWERYLGIPPSPPAPRAHTADEAVAVTGTFRNPSSELEIALAAGALALHQRPKEDYGFRKLQRDPPPPPEPASLAFTATGGRLVLTSGPGKDTQIELLSREWIRFSSRLYGRVSP